MANSMLPPAHHLPHLFELVGGWSVAPWFTALYEELRTSDSLYQRFAAIGLVASRFQPNSPGELQCFIEDNHRHWIDGRVEIWLTVQTREDLSEVVKLAELETKNLIRDYGEHKANAWPMNELVSLAVSRELLECVIVLLQRRGRANNVLTAVSRLDIDARKKIPFGKFGELESEPQLLVAVRELTPRKWWGRILGQTL